MSAHTKRTTGEEMAKAPATVQRVDSLMQRSAWTRFRERLQQILAFPDSPPQDLIERLNRP